MKKWQIEFRNSHPYVVVRFVIMASSFDEAVREAEQAISGMRRSATYEIVG